MLQLPKRAVLLTFLNAYKRPASLQASWNCTVFRNEPCIRARGAKENRFCGEQAQKPGETPRSRAAAITAYVPRQLTVWKSCIRGIHMPGSAARW